MAAMKATTKGMHGKCGGFDKKVMRQLDLTDAQKTELKSAQKRKSCRDEKEKHAGNKADKWRKWKRTKRKFKI